MGYSSDVRLKEKISRRLSARVGDLFKPKSKQPSESTPAKVEENPPKIDEPAPVAPLENPAAETGAAAPAAESTPAPAATEESKVETTPTVAVSA